MRYGMRQKNAAVVKHGQSGTQQTEKKKRLPTFDFRKCSYMPAARHKVRHQEFRIGPSNLALDAHGQTINKTFQGDSRWSALARSLRGSHQVNCLRENKTSIHSQQTTHHHNKHHCFACFHNRLVCILITEPSNYPIFRHQVQCPHLWMQTVFLPFSCEMQVVVQPLILVICARQRSAILGIK